MRKCKKCGYENNDQDKFCIFCGANIENQDIKPKESCFYQEKILPTKVKEIIKHDDVDNTKYILIVCVAINIILVVFVLFDFGKYSYTNENINNEFSVLNQDIEVEKSINTLTQQVITKYDVIDDVALASKNFYLSYLNASNKKDKNLIHNCTDNLRNELGEDMKENEDYEFFNKKFIFDIGSLEYTNENNQEKVVFKVKTENDGYRYNDESYVNSIICLHIEGKKENNEWQFYFVNKIDPSLLSENFIEVE